MNKYYQVEILELSNEDPCHNIRRGLIERQFLEQEDAFVRASFEWCVRGHKCRVVEVITTEVAKTQKLTPT